MPPNKRGLCVHGRDAGLLRTEYRELSRRVWTDYSGMNYDVVWVGGKIYGSWIAKFDTLRDL